MPHLTLFLLAIAAGPAAESNPPNVVYILADDQAFGDFGFMGHPHVATPHLDRLAAESALFVNGYVPTSLCRPSLATLLTGLYPHRHGIHFNDPPHKGPRRTEANGLLAALPTVPRWLASRGYESLQTGKFWEGSYANAGFTEGMTHGDPNRRRDRPHPTLGRLPGRHGDEGLTIGRDTMAPIADFLDDRVGDGKPFFLWYAPFLPHTPYTPPRRHLETYADLDVPTQVRKYYAMCSWFDETCGTLLAALDERGMADGTLIVFVSDNGWITNPDWRPGTKGQPFAPRSKRSPYESGVRTPIMYRLPGRIAAGRHEQLASSIDIVPTTLAAAGVPRDQWPDLPGVDLWSYLTGDTAEYERTEVFGEIFGHDARTLDDPAAHLLFRWVRRGPWKLIAPTDGPAELYRLTDDPEERHDLANDAKLSEVKRSLTDALDGWWNPASEAGPRRDSQLEMQGRPCSR